MNSPLEIFNMACTLMGAFVIGAYGPVAAYRSGKKLIQAIRSAIKSCFARRNRRRKSPSALGIDIKPMVLTPFGKMDRIEVSANNGQPLLGHDILVASSVGQPLPVGCVERVTIIHEFPERVEILSTTEPRHSGVYMIHDPDDLPPIYLTQVQNKPLKNDGPPDPSHQPFRPPNSRTR